MNTIVKGSETHKTNDYDLFKLNLLNRPVQKYRVDVWKHEFSNDRFFLKTFPITITSEFDITDGQHRFVACKELGLPIYYRFSEEVTLENVADVQKNSKWNTTDFLQSRIQQGNKEYMQLKEFSQLHGISVASCVLILGDDKHQKNKINAFNSGLFKAKNIMRGVEIARVLAAIKNIGFKSWVQRNFVLALIDIHGQYKMDRMIEKIEKFGASTLQNQTSKEHYIKNLESLYNYHTSASNRIVFNRKPNKN